MQQKGLRLEAQKSTEGLLIMKELYLPALKGNFGDWTYYTCMVPLKDLAARVSHADDIHQRKDLSTWLQRVLKKGRVETIVDYLLNEKERFFNSLVVAVYRGDPSWFAAGKITSRNARLRIEDINATAIERIGFLKLTGKEKLFALDGQHRLAGIKRLVQEDPAKADEVQSVILLGHKPSKSGRIRTRRLFTTLNKTAKPVSKSEIIALDEDDVMAITTRRLVENHPYFTGKRIAFNSDANLNPADVHSLTSIVNLYDILQTVFRRISPSHKLDEMKYYRPDDAALDQYYSCATEYFDGLNRTFRPLRTYFAATDFSAVVRRYRTANGGNLLFRPIGLLVMTGVIAKLCKNRTLEQSLRIASRLPLILSRPPYENVLWSRRSGMTTRKALARDLLLWTLGELSQKRSRTVGEQYARALDREPKQWRQALATLKT